MDIYVCSYVAKSQKMDQTRFSLPEKLANVSWFYLIETSIEIINCQYRYNYSVGPKRNRTIDNSLAVVCLCISLKRPKNATFWYLIRIKLMAMSVKKGHDKVNKIRHFWSS